MSNQSLKTSSPAVAPFPSLHSTPNTGYSTATIHQINIVTSALIKTVKQYSLESMTLESRTFRRQELRNTNSNEQVATASLDSTPVSAA